MSEPDTTMTRPRAPETGLLDEAGRALAGLGLVAPGDVEWRLLGRLDRPSSTLFRLRAESGGATGTGVFYKQSIPPPYEEERKARWVATMRDGLERCRRLETRLAGVADAQEVLFSRALAVDPPSLTTVVLEVGGEPLGKPWRHLVGRDRRRRAVGWLERVGRAARLIESCSDDEPAVVVGADDRFAAIERRVGRVAEALDAATMRHVERRMVELDAGAMAQPRPAVYAHGDLSPTNVLVGESLGLIDFTWPAKVRGFDVAHLGFRIEYDTTLPPGVTEHLRRALVAGYGEPDLEDRPGWRLHRLTKLLKIVESGDRRRMRRAVEQIATI